MLIEKNKTILTFSLSLLMVLLGIWGYLTFVKDGLGFRFLGHDYQKIAQLQLSELNPRYGEINRFINECDFIDRMRNEGPRDKDGSLAAPANCYSSHLYAKYTVALWGDSFAQMLAYGLIKNLPSEWGLLLLASRGCQASIYESSPSISDYCKQSNYFALKTIGQLKPDVVVISQNSTLNQQNIDLISNKLHHLGVKKVVYVDKPPKWKYELSKLLFRSEIKGRAKRNRSQLAPDTIEQLLREEVLSFSNNDRYINTVKVFCNSEGCLLKTGDQLESSITSLDKEHLSPSASDYFAKNILIEAIIK